MPLDAQKPAAAVVSDAAAAAASEAAGALYLPPEVLATRPPPEGNQNKHFRRKEGLDLSEKNQGFGRNLNKPDRGKECDNKLDVLQVASNGIEPSAGFPSPAKIIRHGAEDQK